MFIRQLKYLVTLAEVGHFSRAAEACHVSQPALSSAIRKLETELNLQLVRRGRNYEGMTEAGQRVVGWAQHLLSSYEAMRQETDKAQASLSGTLRIGAIPTAMPVLPFMTAPCQAAYGGIDITLLSLPSDEIVRRLDSYDLDLGITFLDDRALGGFQLHSLVRHPVCHPRNTADGRPARRTRCRERGRPGRWRLSLRPVNAAGEAERFPGLLLQQMELKRRRPHRWCASPPSQSPLPAPPATPPCRPPRRRCRGA